MTAVNTPEEPDRPVGPSVAVMLVNAADVIIRHGLPEPVSVQVSTRFGLDVDLATHTHLRVWADRLGMPVHPSGSQPFVREDGVLCQLTNLYGTWRDGRVRLHTLEPVDALPALRGEVDP